MKTTAKPGSRYVMKARYTVRIPRKMDRDLKGLGRIEKRQVADLVRNCMVQALATWHKAHPGKSPFRQPKTVCNSTPKNS
jgi:hypothetical protein